MAEILYLTELVGLTVHDTRGRRIGRVKDAALVPLIDASRVDRILVGGGWAWLTVRYNQVKSISVDGIHLRDELLTPHHNDEYMLRAVRDLLDQQIIDAQGRKVVRVTDLTFEIRGANGYEELRVTEVDVGLRSIFRRIVQGMLPIRWIRRIQQVIPAYSIPWEFCNIVEPDPQRRLRLNITNDLLEKMHPADLADIVEELSPDEREAIFESIDSEVAAEALSEVDPEIQTKILESLEPEKAAQIIEEMSPDEAADVLSELEPKTTEEIFEEMESEPKAEVRELLEFRDDTAGGLMNTEFLALHANATIADAFVALKSNADLLDSVNTLFLVDEEEKLVGSVPLGRLFTTSESIPLRELVADPTIHVPLDEGERHIVELFDKYNLMTLPVVDEEGKLNGVITADDVISVLRER
jgi:sporulation protein YlmC with PRC-barrel domain/CBS domain-containing protein